MVMSIDETDKFVANAAKAANGAVPPAGQPAAPVAVQWMPKS